MFSAVSVHVSVISVEAQILLNMLTNSQTRIAEAHFHIICSYFAEVSEDIRMKQLYVY